MKIVRTTLILGLFAILFLAAGCINTDTGLHNQPVNFTTEEIAREVGDSLKQDDIQGNGSGTLVEVTDPEAVVQVGDTVEVDYVGSLEDSGEVFDTSIKEEAEKAGLPLRPSYAPLKFTVGSGQMIAGFDEAVQGLHLGDLFVAIITPDKGYGERDETKVRKVSWEEVGEGNRDLNVGEEVYTSEGAAIVVSTDEEGVTLDFNHKLAGKTLVFRITLVKLYRPA